MAAAAAGWTAQTMERFEEALAHLAAGNGKALKLSMVLSQAATLEEKQQAVETWRAVAASVTSDGQVTATPQDLSQWFGLAAWVDGWTRQEGEPAPKASEPLGK